jgi:hypothetical protein
LHCRYIEINTTIAILQICKNITTFLGLQKPLISWRYINLTVKLNCRAASLDRGSARGRNTIVKAASNLAQDSPASSGGML